MVFDYEMFHCTGNITSLKWIQDMEDSKINTSFGKQDYIEGNSSNSDHGISNFSNGINNVYNASNSVANREELQPIINSKLNEPLLFDTDEENEKLETELLYNYQPSSSSFQNSGLNPYRTFNQDASYKFLLTEKQFDESSEIQVWSTFLKSGPTSIKTFERNLELAIKHPKNINDIEFKDKLVVASDDGTISIYTFFYLEEERDWGYELTDEYRAHKSTLGGTSRVKFPPNNYLNPEDALFGINSNNTIANGIDTLLSTGFDGTVTLYDINSQKRIFNQKTSEYCIKDVAWFSPSIATLACSDGTVQMLDLRVDGNVKQSFKKEHNKSVGEFNCIVHHPEKYCNFSVGTSYGDILLFDLRKLGQRDVNGGSDSKIIPNRHSNSIESIKHHPLNPDILVTTTISSSLGLTLCCDELLHTIEREKELYCYNYNPTLYSNHLAKTIELENGLVDSFNYLDLHPTTGLALVGSECGLVMIGSIEL
ncbi:hypothetical protein K502DRAFT_263640 [Neoconidiobolus thromboides FSU 785]|nr:hypothetical protein K502DRAFT_263640 [Neoconidiobolus thromboides FSU 785]